MSNQISTSTPVKSNQESSSTYGSSTSSNVPLPSPAGSSKLAPGNAKCSISLAPLHRPRPPRRKVSNWIKLLSVIRWWLMKVPQNNISHNFSCVFLFFFSFLSTKCQKFKTKKQTREKVRSSCFRNWTLRTVWWAIHHRQVNFSWYFHPTFNCTYS